MLWQPKRWSAAQREERRLAAGRLLRAGELAPAEIARRMGVSRASVTRWTQRLQREGMRGLRHRGAPGRASRLTRPRWRRLLRLLARGARAVGCETERWTLRRSAAVVEGEFGVRSHRCSLGRALRARGWGPQRPIARARERDDALVAAWLRRDWPRIQRGLAERGVRLPSWTRRVTRFGPASAPPGRRPASRPSCGG